jgi:hypothetical protein
LNLKLKQAKNPLLNCFNLALCVLASCKDLGEIARTESPNLRLAAAGWSHWFASPAVMTIVRLPDDKSHGSPQLLYRDQGNPLDRANKSFLFLLDTVKDGCTEIDFSPQD